MTEEDFEKETDEKKKEAFEAQQKLRVKYEELEVQQQHKQKHKQIQRKRMVDRRNDNFQFIGLCTCV